jgi:xanthine/uracil permease
MLGNLMTGFLIIAVGLNLAPVVANQVASATGFNSSGGASSPTNLTNGSGSVLSLVTLFFVLAIAVAAMDVAIVGLRQSGLIV